MSGALSLLLAGAAGAQERGPGYVYVSRWSVIGTIGLVGREIATWDPVHDALAASGWDGWMPTGCGAYCPDASKIVEGRPIAPILSARYQVRGRWQARGVISYSKPGSYPGLYNNTTPLWVTPSVTVAGVQGVGSLGPLWFGAGPAWYSGAVHTTSTGMDSSRTGSGLGAVLSAALAVPRSGRVFLELVLERRILGSITMPDVPVSGAPTVPTMTIPLSHTLLSAGAGLRL